MTQQRQHKGSVRGEYPLTANALDKARNHGFFVITGEVTARTEKEVDDFKFNTKQTKVDLRVENKAIASNRPFFVRCNAEDGAPNIGDYIRAFGFISPMSDSNGVFIIATRVEINPTSSILEMVTTRLGGAGDTRRKGGSSGRVDESAPARAAADTYADSQKLSDTGRLNLLETRVDLLEEENKKLRIHVSQLKEELQRFSPKRNNTPEAFSGGEE